MRYCRYRRLESARRRRRHRRRSRSSPWNWQIWCDCEMKIALSNGDKCEHKMIWPNDHLHPDIFVFQLGQKK